MYACSDVGYVEVAEEEGKGDGGAEEEVFQAGTEVRGRCYGGGGGGCVTDAWRVGQWFAEDGA